MEAKDIISHIRSQLEPLGFECYLFKVGWYNECVSKTFELPYDKDTLAAIIISTPSMFDKTLKPFIMRNLCTGIRDPIDECITQQLQRVKQSLSGVETDILLDYELDHNRRPRILVQTAGHVAGATRYYQRGDIQDDPWESKKKIFGVCIHPIYGGWFAFRGVLIFKNITSSDLKRKDAPDPIPDNKSRIELLRRFNECWQDCTFRDMVTSPEKYSDEQILYFSTLPKNRKELVEKMMGNTASGTGT